MCDKINAEEIVGEMLEYLEIVDYLIREEMVGFFIFKVNFVKFENLFLFF